MEDMDVLIARIEGRIEVCKRIIKSTEHSEVAENRMDAFKDVLKEIEQIKGDG